MEKRLASPEKWIAPLLRQAWADFLVAQFLQSSELENEIHHGLAPLDAVLDKYQQSLEKLLKSILLMHVPDQSQLTFKHRFVTDRRVQGVKKVGSALDKFFRSTASTTNYHSILGRLEALVPNPEAAERDEDNRIVGLPQNAQYPYTRGGAIVCPCDGFMSWHSKVMGISKDLRALFGVIRGDELFAEYATGLKLPGFGKAVKKRRSGFNG